MVLKTTSDQKAISKIKIPLKSKNNDEPSKLIRTTAILELLTSRTSFSLYPVILKTLYLLLN
jgi:hypothetical protein